MITMNKKLISLLVVILFMSIGFAAIVISLNIEGTSKVAFDEADFNIFFSKVGFDNSLIDNFSEDRDEFTYTSNGIDYIYYYVINRSVNYNAVVNVTCDQEVDIYQENEVIMAGTVQSGSIGSSYVGDITCTLNALPTPRTYQNNNDAIKITLDPEEGTLDVDEFYVVKGYNYGVLPKPVLAGSYFVGWYKEADFSGEPVNSYTTVDLEEDTTLHALWIKPRGFVCNRSEATYIAPRTGIYRIQAWGAQGGSIGDNIGGYGGYATGYVLLEKDTKLYINVGCQGDAQTERKAKTVAGGYNGGGSGFGKSDKLVAGGGGATSVSLYSGLLKNQYEHVSDLLLVAGGGGGAAYEEEQKYANGGHGGGACGTMNTTTATGTVFYPKDPGCQTGTNFGYGTDADSSTSGSGGGGGFFGGQWGNFWSGGSGGSGYLGSHLYSSSKFTKYMACFNCDADLNAATKTNSITCHYETPTSNCAKENDGYVSVMFIDTVK